MSEVNLFVNIVSELFDEITVLIFANGSIEMLDDLLVPETAACIVPLSEAIHPENCIFFRDHHLM